MTDAEYTQMIADYKRLLDSGVLKKETFDEYLAMNMLSEVRVMCKALCLVCNQVVSPVGVKIR